MSNDIPEFTNNEIRALIYLKQLREERPDTPLTITQLSKNTDWTSTYWTRAWKKLQPRNLVQKNNDGRHSRIKLTSQGAQVADKFMEINEVLTP